MSFLAPKSALVAIAWLLASAGGLHAQPAQPASPAARAPAAAAPGECRGAPSAFGSKDPLRVGIEGKIYFLAKNTRALPDFATLESQGSIYTAKWDVPARRFTEGFPGVTDRFEWFALDYQGTIYVAQPGKYAFRMASDDGSVLSIDGNVVINLNGLHAWAQRAGAVELSAGEHALRVSYMQGPAAGLGLQVWVTPPGAKEQIFNLQDFSKEVLDSRGRLEVTETDKEIRVNLGAEVLFDTGKFALRPPGVDALQKLAVMLQSYPGLPILIDGHTDNVGSAESNQTLSVNRARAVQKWLAAEGGVPGACLATHGYGEMSPVAANDTAEGRQKNRRVEITLQKVAPTAPKKGR